jgi:hypothetical protein
MLSPLWLKRVCQFSQNLPSEALASLDQKSCQFSRNLPSDALASLAQKSRQFSRNLPSDEAHLFGSIEELGTKKKKTTVQQEH